MLLRKIICLISLLAIAVISQGASNGEVDPLRQELDRLKRINAAQARAIRTLERRFLAGEKVSKQTADQTRQSPVDESEQAVAQATDEKVVKKPKPSRSTENILQEDHVLFDRLFVIEPEFRYAHTDRNRLELSGFLALDAIFLGSISVDNVESDILTVDITGRYSPTDRLQFDLNAPFVYRTTNFSSTGAQGGATDATSERSVATGPQLGDLSFGFNYRVFTETATRPDLVWLLRVKAPTGTDPFGIDRVSVPGSTDNLSIPEVLPTGTGTWRLASGFSVLKTIDPAIVFGNVQYFHELEQRFDDIDDDPETRISGDIDLGDAIQLGVGLAFALNEEFSLSLSYSQRFIMEAKQRQEGEEWQTITGSDANIGVFNVGATYSFTDRLSVTGNLGVGLTNDASDLSFGMRLPYSF